MSGKRLKRKRKKHKAKAKTAGQQRALQMFEHPFNGVDRAAMQAALSERGATALVQLPAALERLLGHFRTVDPWVTVSTVSFYGTLQAVGPDGPNGRTFLSGVEQHHIELLHALALTVPEGDVGHLPPGPDVIQAVIEDIVLLADAFAWARLGQADEDRTADQHALASLQELLRLHTQVVRNWGYVHQVEQLSTELYGLVDLELEQTVGFRATDVIRVIVAMARLFEQRASGRFESLATVITADTVEQMVRAYCAAFPHLQGSPETLLPAFEARSRDEVAAMLLTHSELSLPSLVSFGADILATETSIPAQRVQAVLERLSLPPGGLSGQEPSHFFMGNPVWSRPGVRVDSTFVFPTPQIGMSHIHRVVRRVIEEAGIKTAYERRRADFLEAKIGELLRRAFPMARALPSVQWALGNAQYETDWLIVLDRAVLIVEAKSAGLTDEALRGAPKRMKRHIEDLVVDPAMQSQRLEEVIGRAKADDGEAQRVIDKIGIDVTSVDTIVRLSITLDDLSMITMAEDELRELGWLPRELSLPATIHLADFETVIDILEQPALILHYLAERAPFQRTASILADEVDLLGVYLHSLFNLPQLGTEKVRLVASGESRSIDEYYNRLQAGMQATKPSPAIAPQMLIVLKYLAERMPPGWITISLDLLSIGNRHQQAELWNGLERLRKRVPHTQIDPQHDCAMIALTQNNVAVVALYVFTAHGAPHRFLRVEQLANEQLEASGRKRVTIIGKQVEHWGEPYRFAAVAYARPSASKALPA